MSKALQKAFSQRFQHKLFRNFKAPARQPKYQAQTADLASFSGRNSPPSDSNIAE
jgi:hypothetical protein